MQVSAEAIKVLREQTSAGLMECKRALQESSGDIAAATEILKQRGHAMAKKKETRVVGQGLVEAYIHGGGANWGFGRGKLRERFCSSYPGVQRAGT